VTDESVASPIGLARAHKAREGRNQIALLTTEAISTNQANRPRADGAQAPPASGPVERVVRHAQAASWLAGNALHPLVNMRHRGTNARAAYTEVHLFRLAQRIVLRGFRHRLASMFR